MSLGKVMSVLIMLSVSASSLLAPFKCNELKVIKSN
jgi:hypothetical protein